MAIHVPVILEACSGSLLTIMFKSNFLTCERVLINCQCCRLRSKENQESARSDLKAFEFQDEVFEIILTMFDVFFIFILETELKEEQINHERRKDRESYLQGLRRYRKREI